MKWTPPGSRLGSRILNTTLTTDGTVIVVLPGLLILMATNLTLGTGTGTHHTVTAGGIVEPLVVAGGFIAASVPHQGITLGARVATDLTGNRAPTLLSSAAEAVVTATGTHLGLAMVRRGEKAVLYPPAGLRGVTTRLMVTVLRSPIPALGVRLLGSFWPTLIILNTLV